MSTAPEPLELRCPAHRPRLLAMLFLTGAARVVADGTLVEVACEACTRDAGKRWTVAHRWDTAGRLVGTVRKPRAR